MQKKLQVRNEKNIKDKVMALKELESCKELETPERGLNILRNIELKKLKITRKIEVQCVYYKLCFLNDLGWS